jgi:predicted membrane-bound spermidine synthase
MIRENTIRVEFVFIGVASVFTQVLLLRLLVGLFGGSDILYAIFITVWLVETGAWSWVAELMSRRRRLHRWLLPISYAALAFSIAVYLAVPMVREHIFTSYGSVPLSTCAVFGVAVMIVPTLFPGAAFPAVYLLRKRIKGGVGRAYYLDTLGFAIGGLILTAILVVSGSDACLLILLLPMGLAVNAMLRLRGLLRWTAMIVSAVACIVLLYDPAMDAGRAMLSVDRDDCSRYAGLNDGQQAMSPYGRFLLETDNGQSFVFFNSRLLSSTTGRESAEAIVLPLAMCADRKRICVVGNATDGKALFALIDPAVDVVQIEPDPVASCIFHTIYSDSIARSGIDGRLSLVVEDPTRYLSDTGPLFDVIFINYTDPTGASIANLFTVEFLDIVERVLKPGGVVAFSVKCGENFVQPKRLEYLRDLKRTLGEVFPYTIMIPGEQAMLIGGKSGSRLTVDPHEILSALYPYVDHLMYYGDAYLPDRLSEFRRMKLDDLLSQSEGSVLTVQKPAQILANTILEMDMHQGIDSDLLGFIERMPGWVLFGICLFPLGVLTLLVSVRRRAVSTFIPVLFAGWFGLSFEINIMMIYQAVAGSLFSRLGLIVGIYMIGSGAGAYVGRILSSGTTNVIRMLRYAIWSGVVLATISALATPWLLSDPGARVMVEVLLYVVSAIAGFIPGAIFALSAGVGERRGDAESPGGFYAADLIGAAFGGILTSVAILPVLGVQPAFLLLGASGFIVGIYLAFRT